MGVKQRRLESLVWAFIIRHCTNRALSVGGTGGDRGASKPGDKQLGCEESEE